MNNLIGVIHEAEVVWSSSLPSPYGAIASSAFKPSDNPLLAYAQSLNWQGKAVDSTGLIWMGARYYDPLSGRFLSPDPLAYPNCLDLYAYANGDPVNFNDPDGRCACQAFQTTHASTIDGSNSQYQWTRDESVIKFNQNLIEYWDETCYFERTSCHVVGNFKISGVGIGFTNGILNDLKSAKCSAELVSDMAGGYKVDLVHNPTGGVHHDAQRYLFSLDYHASPAVLELHKVWNNFIDANGPNARYLQIASSEGCLNVRNALMSYDHKRRQQISALLIAPGGFVDKEYCYKALHYTSASDVVYLIDGEGQKRNTDTLHILPKHPDAWCFDHFFNSPTFTDIIRVNLENFLINRF